VALRRYFNAIAYKSLGAAVAKATEAPHAALLAGEVKAHDANRSG
jgi:hypothetical protein